MAGNFTLLVHCITVEDTQLAKWKLFPCYINFLKLIHLLMSKLVNKLIMKKTDSGCMHFYHTLVSRNEHTKGIKRVNLVNKPLSCLQ